MTRKEEAKNKSVIFLLPMLLSGNTKELISLICKEHYKTDCFLNTYYHNEEDIDYNENYKNRIYLVFDRNKIKQELVNELAKCTNYQRCDTNNDFLIFCFKIPDIYLSNFLLFKEGKYSLFSNDYKKYLMHCWPSKLDLKDILYPTKEKIEQLKIILTTQEKIKEIQSKPDMIKETFKLSNYFNIKTHENSNKNTDKNSNIGN